MVTIILMIACLSLLGAAVSCAPTGANAPHGEAEGLLIINAHMHLNHDMAAETLIALMESAGVKRMVLMARYSGDEKGSDQQSLEYARKYPGRFIPFVGGQRPELRRSPSPGMLFEKTQARGQVLKHQFLIF